MKRFLAISVILFIVIACKKTKVLSLDEQIQGRWLIKSYGEEQYQPAISTIIQWEVAGRPGDYIDFTPGKMYLHFDSGGTVEWSYTIADPNTLQIEGRRWDIVKLDPANFELSAALMNAMYKIRDTIRFDLVKP